MLHELNLRAKPAQEQRIIHALLECSLKAEHFFNGLLFFFEVGDDWVAFPEEFASQITKGAWDSEIAELLNQGLIEVETPEEFWARFDGFPVALAA